MPELPEVETIRKTLAPVLTQQVIAEGLVLYPRVLPLNHHQEFSQGVQDEKINTIWRRGKYLLFALSRHQLLIFHLRMTGQLLFYPAPPAERAKHTSAVFRFYSGCELHFVDQRKFGTIYLVTEPNLPSIKGLSTLGPEPLAPEFQVADVARFVQSKRPIKAILLDQTKVAGLGNIYSDEILYRAGIHPQRPGASLKPAEIEALYQNICLVLQAAIQARGTTIRDYRTGSGAKGSFQNELLVYGKTGKECPRCGQPIEKLRIAGRSSHFCPNCQRWDQPCGD